MMSDTIPWIQFGFMQGHSTVNAHSVFKGEMDKSKAKREFMAVGSLDIRKACDSVWNRGLVFKIGRSGCDLFTTNLVKSFLNNRTARLKIDDELPPCVKIGRGVPQGTKLGPRLYNFYTADCRYEIAIKQK